MHIMFPSILWTLSLSKCLYLGGIQQGFEVKYKTPKTFVMVRLDYALKLTSSSSIVKHNLEKVYMIASRESFIYTHTRARIFIWPLISFALELWFQHFKWQSSLIHNCYPNEPFCVYSWYPFSTTNLPIYHSNTCDCTSIRLRPAHLTLSYSRPTSLTWPLNYFWHVSYQVCILDDIKPSSNYFQITLCGCQEIITLQGYKLSSPTKKSHCNLYSIEWLHLYLIKQFQNILKRGLKQTPKEFRD